MQFKMFNHVSLLLLLITVHFAKLPQYENLEASRSITPNSAAKDQSTKDSHWSRKSYDSNPGVNLQISEQKINEIREKYWSDLFHNTAYASKHLDGPNPDFNRIRRHFRFTWMWTVDEEELRDQYTKLLSDVLTRMRQLHHNDQVRELNLVYYRQLLSEVNSQSKEPPVREDWTPEFRRAITYEVDEGPGHVERWNIDRADQGNEKSSAERAYERILMEHYENHYSEIRPAVEWSPTAHMLIPSGTMKWPREHINRQFVSQINYIPKKVSVSSQLLPGIGNLIESKGILFTDSHSYEDLQKLPLHCIRNGLLAIKNMIAGNEMEVSRLIRAEAPVWKQWTAEDFAAQKTNHGSYKKSEKSTSSSPEKSESNFYTDFDEESGTDREQSGHSNSHSKPNKNDPEESNGERQSVSEPQSNQSDSTDVQNSESGSLLSGFKRHLVKTKLGKKIVDKIADVDVKFSLKLFNLDLYEGVGISSKYRYEVEPSYVDNYYTRVDTWNLNSNIRPGDILSEEPLPFGLSMEKGEEVHFVRQFKSKSKALKALPYNFKHFPYNSEQIISKLNPGDFVAIPAHLNLVIGRGLGMLSDILSGTVGEYYGFNAGLNAHYLLSGKFQLHVFKMANNRVRIRVLAQRQQKGSIAAHAEIGFLGTGLDFFLIKIVDRQIRKWTRIQLSKSSVEKEYGRIFLADYVFNLNNSEAREALDGILASQFKFRETEIINPLKDNDKPISEKMVHDLSLIEDIVYADKALENNSRRINRLYRGESIYNRHSNNLEIGIKIIQYGRKFHRTENFLSYLNEDNQKDYYLYPTFTRYKEFEALFGIFKHSNTHTVYGLFPANSSGEPTNFGEWGTTWEFRSKRFGADDQERIINFVDQNLPASIVQKIPWGEWKTIQFRENARMRFHVIFEKYAFDQIANYDLFELFEKFNEFKESIPEMPESKRRRAAGPRNQFETGPTDWFEENRRQIAEMLEGIYLVSRDEIPAMERMRGLEELLKENDVFRLLGTGYLMSLLNEDSQQKGTYVQFELYAEKTKAIRFQHGGQANARLRELLMYINNVLNNRNFDIRMNPTELDEINALQN